MMTDATRPAEPAETQPHGPPEESSARVAPSVPFSEVLAATGTVGGEQAGASLQAAGDPNVVAMAQASLQALLAALPSGPSLPRVREAAAARGPAPFGRRAASDPLDPASRQSAQLAPPMLTSSNTSHAVAPDAPVQASARASLETVLPALVRRIAWSGDGRKGSLRLEFGYGTLAGGTLVVHSDDGRVRVELHAPTGADAAAWRERIVSRLEARRIEVEDVDVR